MGCKNHLRLPLERWLIKFVCGTWAAGGLARVWSCGYQPNATLVEVVFGSRKLEKPCGLWMAGTGERLAPPYTYPFTLEFECRFSGSLLLSVIFHLNATGLILNLTSNPLTFPYRDFSEDACGLASYTP